ncbi:MAG: aldo/keto reductase [Anaerolineae bacterium]|nr:aldo/keto reductase [Anaerolineae bacterium]
MEKRKLGKTGERLSVVGFGGIAVMDEEPSVAGQLVATAVNERGINYFDVAPSYGNAEERLGPALEPYRNSVFLACKTGKRNAKDAEAELTTSLERLRTDHFDLYQLHAVTTMEDVNEILGPGGALETFVRAREKGLVRFLGFSAHSEEAALALMDQFAFDTILFPINWVCWHKGKFGPRVLERASEKGMGILALKTMAKRRWREGEQRKWSKTWYSPVDSFEEALGAVRFTLSKPITAGTSPGHAQLLWWMCDAADQFTPITPKEDAELSRRAQKLDPIFPQA